MIQHVDKYPIYSIFDRDARFYYGAVENFRGSLRQA